VISFMSQVHSQTIQLHLPFGLCEFKKIYVSAGVLKILQALAAVGKITVSIPCCYSLKYSANVFGVTSM